MLTVERSNRIENLLAGLAERLARPGNDPLTPRIVVVQGQGMERWISQTIAQRHGVCANVDFLFPRRLLERVFAAATEDALDATNPRWEPEKLMWTIARLLGSRRDDPELDPLARHLRAEDGDWRALQLAHQLANLFDHYITYRPETVLGWCASGPLPAERDERWQAWLFRALQEDLGPGHVADRAHQLRDRVAGAGPEGREGAKRVAERLRSELPETIEVFAVSTLAPLYLSVLEGLGTAVDVRLSVLSPSRHYWADLWSELRDEETLAPASSEGVGGASGHGIGGLLAGLGRLGGEFQRNLEQIENVDEADADLFEGPERGGATLLEQVQARMLDLDPDASQPIARDDASLRVHLCHGPKRELEVVLAELRAAFDRDATLTPEDVLVMAPDIDAIAPLVDAVFGGATGDAIPFRIADRGTFRRSPVAETFAALLELLSGRGGRSEVLDWLSREPARAKLELDADGVEALAEWAERAGVRFGFDAAHRASLGLAEESGHSWAGGLDRLVLGHAVGASPEVFAGLASEPLGPFSDRALLGALGDLMASLARARAEIAEPRRLEIWCEWLGALLAETLDQSDGNAHEHAAIRAALEELSEAGGEARFETTIPFAAIRERLRHALEASPPPQGFLAGGITFCELVPLRAIPFRVIAILGLKDGAFPRSGAPASYDLIARDPRPGDRSARHDDRYLFLEALLSAREQLILTVPGRDLRDGSDQPASVVVSELLDAIDADFAFEDAAPREGARDRLVVSHPLQSFSPRYFESGHDRRLRGLDAEAFSGAEARDAAIRSGGGDTRAFLGILAEGSPGSVEVGEAAPRLGLDELVERVLRSTRYFARDRLGLRMPRPERSVGDFDPVMLGPLEQYGLGSALLEALRAGASPEIASRRMLASAQLPAGETGRLAAESLLGEVELLAEIAAERLAGARLEEHAFEIELAEVGSIGRAILGGRLRDVGSRGLMRIDFGRVGRRGELEFWIHHLVLCVLVEQGAPFEARSVLVARPESSRSQERVVELGPVSGARERLSELVAWAASVDAAPLPFFPRSSWAYAEKALVEKEDQGFRDAYQKFHGGDSKSFDFPESQEELETVRVWEGADPLEPAGSEPVLFRFDDLALRFFGPLREARGLHER